LNVWKLNSLSQAMLLAENLVVIVREFINWNGCHVYTTWLNGTLKLYFMYFNLSTLQCLTMETIHTNFQCNFL